MAEAAEVKQATTTSKDVPATTTTTTTTNPRGIPTAPFLDNITDYVTSRADVEPTLRNFQEMLSKYQFMELNQQRRAAGLKDKMPDIQKTLDMVRFLRSRAPGANEPPIETTFELNETLYARALVEPTDEVYLWLGANVMLAYPIGEAEQLLDERLTAARTNLQHCEEDLEFLREQITTMEVNTARVYNWDVVMKRKEKAEAEADEAAEGVAAAKGKGKGKASQGQGQTGAVVDAP